MSSSYSAIGDSSHPYSSRYQSSSAAASQTGDSQAIQVSEPSTTQQQQPYQHTTEYQGEPTAGPSTFNSRDGGQRISRYETSLPLRYDVEAALAYLLGVFSGIILLVMEKKNDYVRFHAWQACLLSAAMIALLVFTAIISSFLNYVAVIATIASHAFMVRRAYVDGTVFERFELPYIGPLAAQYVDEE